MVQCANATAPQWGPTANYICQCVVYMAGRHFSSANINKAKAKKGRWLGTDWSEYQMSRTPDYEDLASGATRWDHGGMADVMETAGDAR